jgi:hypothetical protein
MRETMNVEADDDFIAEPDGRNHLRSPDVDGRIIL